MESSNTAPGSAPALLRLSPGDNVLVVTRSLPAGSELVVGEVGIRLATALGLGHKLAAREIRAGEKIIKCHAPIGSATRDIAVGEHVHLHNIKSDYLPTFERGGTHAENPAP
jgi:hypothetical protein